MTVGEYRYYERKKSFALQPAEHISASYFSASNE